MLFCMSKLRPNFKRLKKAERKAFRERVEYLIPKIEKSE